MTIFTIYFSSPSLYSNINALQDDIIFDGKTTLYQFDSIGNNKRFVKILIKNGNEKYIFQGNREEVQYLIDTKVSIIIYQGFFNKYALVNK